MPVEYSSNYAVPRSNASRRMLGAVAQYCIVPRRLDDDVWAQRKQRRKVVDNCKAALRLTLGLTLALRSNQEADEISRPITVIEGANNLVGDRTIADESYARGFCQMGHGV